MKTPNYRPSTFIILLAIIVFFLGLLMAFFAYRTAEDLHYDASIINHAGIIRGSIQRATKQTLSDSLESEQSAAEIIDTVDTLIARFLSAQEDYRHRGAEQESELIRGMHELSEEWRDLKDTFVQYRRTRSEQLQRQVIDKSERCWDLADAGVLTAQHASENKLQTINLIYLVVALTLLIIAMVVWFSYVHVRRRLEYHAAYDAMTSLLNRRSYEAALETEVSRSKRYNRDLSLILFDIDHFKSINDRFGHKTGDKCLGLVSTVAKQQIRKEDSIYRIGGDEFAIIVPEANMDQAYQMAEKIRNALEQCSVAPIERVTVSLGVSELENDMTIDAFCHSADAALYQSKQSGRNIVSRMPVTASGRA